jgi:pimeloyl-ACP methyl ester carboxylesterase
VAAADLVGHSLGGHFGLYFTIAEPARVRRLVLLGAPGAAFAGTKPVPAMRIASLAGLGRVLLSVPVSPRQSRRNNEAMLGRGVFDRWPGEMAEVGYHASRRPGFAPSVASFFRCLATPAGVRPRVVVPVGDLESVTAPVLLIWGDRDVFLTPGAARTQCEAFPEAWLVELHGGHAPWLDEPDASSKELTGFLCR